MFNFGENAHNSNCTAVVGQTSLFLSSNFNYVCNLYLKYDKKNWSIPCHPSRMNLYWTGCEIWLVKISRMSKEFQRPLKLNGTALFPSDLDTETVSWHFLPADAYCLQIWIENALDHLGMSQHKAFHLHQLLKWKI